MKWDKYIVSFAFLAILLIGGYLQFFQRDFTYRKTKSGLAFRAMKFTTLDSVSGFTNSIKAIHKDLKNYRDITNEMYEDHFSIESDFFGVFQYFESNVFATNPIPNKVMEGDDGYLFLGDDFSMAFSESKGFELFRGGHFKLIKPRLCAKRWWLEKQGISYYVTIAPNKLTVYDEKIPIRKATENTKRVQVKEFFNDAENPIIDLAESLLNYKEEGLYFKTDTHWNDLGAYYSYVQLLTEIKQDFPRIPILQASDFSKETIVSYQNDQTRMLQTKREEIATSFKVKQTRALEVAQELCIPDYYNQGFTIYEKRYKSDVNDLKVLVLGDSFGTWWGKYLAESFGEVVVLRHNRFDPDLILKEQPDIVINEFVERNIEELMVRPTRPLEEYTPSP